MPIFVKSNEKFSSHFFVSHLFSSFALIGKKVLAASNKKKIITVLLSTSFQISFIIWCQRANLIGRSLIQSLLFSLPLCLLFISSCLCNRFKRRRKVFGSKERSKPNICLDFLFYHFWKARSRDFLNGPRDQLFCRLNEAVSFKNSE